jgi:hypothetical protein
MAAGLIAPLGDGPTLVKFCRMARKAEALTWWAMPTPISAPDSLWSPSRGALWTLLKRLSLHTGCERLIYASRLMKSALWSQHGTFQSKDECAELQRDGGIG